MPEIHVRPLAPLRPRRRITGIVAVLLPHTGRGEIDWEGFRGILARTSGAGLVPAVNMDTGFGRHIREEDRLEVLRTAATCSVPDPSRPDRFVAGVHVLDTPGDGFDFDAYASALETVTAFGGTPIVFPSWGLSGLRGDALVAAHRSFGETVDRFLGFELGPAFLSEGRIWSLQEFEGVMQIEACAGVKHSSLHREPEWERLGRRDAIRPEFMVLSGNDRAIDMVTYGSDWLLGLGTFAPDAFAVRDRLWEYGDQRFWALNDLLQYLGSFAFREPVPAYRHDAARFLRLRGWIGDAGVPAGAELRPDSDEPVLREILGRLESVLTRLDGEDGDR
ncbi:MAG: dihydrodipicolinate synthase family protein [Acidimicrobiia bacterium]|nr:dihydrodipicolinate synthase family protein [Acidimicrobiia bacterium]